MNKKKKRGIIVPVMALAVCAVAMVGLGFAITSSVTTDRNSVEDLMIDLSDNKSYFDTGGDGEKKPGSKPVDRLLSISFGNEKVQSGENGSNTWVVEGGCAYLKVYGNITNDEFKLTVSATQSATMVQGMKISLFTPASYSSPVATANITTMGNDTDFLNIGNISCNTIYVVAITEITTTDGLIKISYSETGSNIEGELADGSVIPSITQTGTIEYVFKATTVLS